jgi:SAM-dependent methyltransferase
MMSEDFSAGCGEGFVNPEQRSELSVREQMAQTYAQLVAQRGAYWWYAVREFVLERMRLHQGGKLYDAGCGVGLYTLAIAERFAAVEIFAVDFSPASLQQLRQQLDGSSVGTRVQLFCADITHFLPPAPVRWVLCTEVLQHLPTLQLRRQALERFYQALHPGGELWLLVARHRRWHRRRGIPKEIDERPHGGYFRMRFLPRELLQELHRAGFRRIRLYGAPVPPVRLGRRLPASLWRCALWLERLPVSAYLGEVLIAQAHKPC